MRGITIHGNGEGATLLLPGYGVNSSDTYVMVNQVAQFWGISYNGLHGTAIKLVCGQEVRAECWPDDVARALCAATHLQEPAP